MAFGGFQARGGGYEGTEGCGGARRDDGVCARDFTSMPASAEPLSAAADKAGIFRIIELKGSAVKWGSPRWAPAPP
jgi:hypothetical protein